MKKKREQSLGILVFILGILVFWGLGFFGILDGILNEIASAFLKPRNDGISVMTEF